MRCRAYVALFWLCFGMSLFIGLGLWSRYTIGVLSGSRCIKDIYSDAHVKNEANHRHIYTCTRTRITHAPTHTSHHIASHPPTYTHHTHNYTYTHMHTHIHTHTHTHTHLKQRPRTRTQSRAGRWHHTRATFRSHRKDTQGNAKEQP